METRCLIEMVTRMRMELIALLRTTTKHAIAVMMIEWMTLMTTKMTKTMKTVFPRPVRLAK